MKLRKTINFGSKLSFIRKTINFGSKLSFIRKTINFGSKLSFIRKTINFGSKLSFILSFLFSRAPRLLLHICTTTIISLEPCALNAECHSHFILRFTKMSLGLLSPPYSLLKLKDNGSRMLCILTSTHVSSIKGPSLLVF